jgi:hypothetical protein
MLRILQIIIILWTNYYFWLSNEKMHNFQCKFLSVVHNKHTCLLLKKKVKENSILNDVEQHGPSHYLLPCKS